MQIHTERLILHAATQEIVSRELAFLRDPSQKAIFEKTLGATVATWPHLYYDEMTCAYTLDKLSAHPDQVGWRTWYILRKREQGALLLIGTAGFHAPPDATGSAEIGYGLIDEYHRQGLAPETVNALTHWAFDHAAVTKLIITTLDMPELVPSSKVALKCGYHFVGAQPSDEGTLLIYAISREEYAKRQATERQ
jgi:RimJ/RimL family protein N-acetyltransferase